MTIFNKHRVCDIGIAVLQHIGAEAAGIIPLHIHAVGTHLCQELFQFCSYLRAVGAAFHVEEIAIEPIILCHFRQLISNGIPAVFVGIQHHFKVLIGSGLEHTSQGQHAVFVCCIGVSRVGQVDQTKLKITAGPGVAIGGVTLVLNVVQLFRSADRGHSMPGSVLVYILPEIENVSTELVGVGIAVEECIAVVTGQGEILSFRQKIGVGLCCSQCSVAILQRNLCTEQLSIRVCFRRPIHNVFHAIAVLIGLVIAFR